jgi:hypothetical protein
MVYDALPKRFNKSFKLLLDVGHALGAGDSPLFGLIHSVEPLVPGLFRVNIVIAEPLSHFFLLYGQQLSEHQTAASTGEGGGNRLQLFFDQVLIQRL